MAHILSLFTYLLTTSVSGRVPGYPSYYPTGTRVINYPDTAALLLVNGQDKGRRGERQEGGTEVGEGQETEGSKRRDGRKGMGRRESGRGEKGYVGTVVIYKSRHLSMILSLLLVHSAGSELK